MTATPDRDFLQLRVYQIEHRPLPFMRPSTHLTQVAEETAKDSEGTHEDSGIFKLYWLGYLPVYFDWNKNILPALSC